VVAYMKDPSSLNVFTWSSIGRRSSIILFSSRCVWTFDRDSRLCIGNVLALAKGRRVGTLASSSCVFDVVDGLLLGRVESDHILDGDSASSERASSPVVIAPVRTSNGFVSVAYIFDVERGSTSEIRPSSSRRSNSSGCSDIVAASWMRSTGIVPCHCLRPQASISTLNVPRSPDRREYQP
jgi:hypothetical protein